MKNVLTKDEILGLGCKLKTKDIPVPELKKDAYIRIQELTAVDRDELESVAVDSKGNVNLKGLRAKALSLSIVDDDGKKLFTEKTVNSLGRLKGTLLLDLYAHVAEMSGLTADTIEKTEKNLEAPSLSEEDSSSD